MLSKEIEVKIFGISGKGNGIGAFRAADGSERHIEVPFTMPGDEIKAFKLGKRKGIIRGALKEIITPSAERIVPRCRHFGICGGCRWQHLTYEKQLELKEKFVRRCFAPLLNANVDFHPIIPCKSPWEYRNKMEYTFSQNREGIKFLGLVQENTKGKAFNLQECFLTHPWFVEAVRAVREWWQETGLEAYQPHKNTGSLRTLIVREGIRTGDRLVMLTVSGNPDYAMSKQQLEMLASFIRSAIEPDDPSCFLTIFLRIQQIAKGKPTNFFEMLLYGPGYIREGLKIETWRGEIERFFEIGPSSFFQPNTLQAEKLYAKAIELTKIPKDAMIYDLFCGTGTLGIIAADWAKEVIGIELSPESSLDARTNVKLNGLSNVQIITGDAGTVISELMENNKKVVDVAIVDPPRTGLDKKAIQNLLLLKAEKLLYISCNPLTQAENLIELQKGGYALNAVQPVDQFPQTFHIENIAVLTYQNGAF